MSTSRRPPSPPISEHAAANPLHAPLGCTQPQPLRAGILAKLSFVASESEALLVVRGRQGPLEEKAPQSPSLSRRGGGHAPLWKGLGVLDLALAHLEEVSRAHLFFVVISQTAGAVQQMKGEVQCWGGEANS